MSQLKVFGEASNQVIKVISITQSPEVNLLELLSSQGLPIGSSCMGKGECLKCNDANHITTCQITLQQYIDQYGDTISFTYL